MAFIQPGRLFIEQHGDVTSLEDVMGFVEFLRKEARLGVNPPLDLSRIYSRFNIPAPKLAPLEDQQGLLLDPEQGIVLIKDDDPITRQKFTECHELIEYLFSALPEGKGWATRQAGQFKAITKEKLCNQGAAELLMPRATFLPRVLELGVSFQTGRSLAKEYNVSTTAALVQMARLAPGSHAVVLWRMKNKPTEQRSSISPDQISLFEQTSNELPPKKLRVEWSLASSNAPFIPPDKSVSESTSIYAAWASENFIIGTDNLNLGNTHGQFKCENQPFNNNGERFVISLLHLPSDTQCPLHNKLIE